MACAEDRLVSDRIFVFVRLRVFVVFVVIRRVSLCQLCSRTLARCHSASSSLERHVFHRSAWSRDRSLHRLKRLVNLSFAFRSAVSGSMPSFATGWRSRTAGRPSPPRRAPDRSALAPSIDLAQLVDLLLDLLDHVPALRPVEADRRGAGADLVGAQQGGQRRRDAARAASSAVVAARRAPAP